MRLNTPNVLHSLYSISFVFLTLPNLSWKLTARCLWYLLAHYRSSLAFSCSLTIFSKQINSHFYDQFFLIFSTCAIASTDYLHNEPQKSKTPWPHLVLDADNFHLICTFFMLCTIEASFFFLPCVSIRPTAHVFIPTFFPLNPSIISS